MKKSFIIIVFFIFHIVEADQIADDRFIVYINNLVDNFHINENSGKTNVEELNKQLDKVGSKSISQWLKRAKAQDRDGDIYLNRFYIIHLSEGHPDIQSLLKEFESLDCINTAEIIVAANPHYIPNDSYWGTQYEMTLIQADLAYDLWDIDNGEIPGHSDTAQYSVAVVDAGLDWDHPDLINDIWQNMGEDADGDGVVLVQSGNNWIFDPDDVDGIDNDEDGYEDNFIGWDFGTDDNDPVPLNNNYTHGTEVAGNAGASTNNQIGLASAGWGTKVMGANCGTGTDGTMWTTEVFPALLGSAQMGANVINLSLGYDSYLSYGQTVVNSSYNNYGAIIVASSGNGGADGNTNFDTQYPAGYDNVISVSAVGPNDNFPCWPTAGETVDICAPGSYVVTTEIGGGYNLQISGTSFAAPITSSAIALLCSRFPDADNAFIEERVLSTADYFPDMDGSCQGNSLTGMLGAGRLNIYKALSAGINPSLYISDVNYLNDTDEDGVFNPGEQVQVKLIIGNEEGWADAENVVATISSEDDRIAIIDNEIAFTTAIPSGGTAFTLIDHFLIYAFEDVALGDVSCTVHLQAGMEEPFYETEIEFDISISLNQYGFPVDGMVIKSSPIVGDFDGNGISEIFYGSDNGNFYGYTIAGYAQYGFPFNAGDDVRSSPTVRDIDADGVNEIVFGSNNGNLYILTPFGSQELLYNTPGSIIGSPAIVDLDLDGDHEIVFTTQDGNAGQVYAIDHDGNDVDGFPVDLNERMMVGAAAGDLEGDGNADIVVCTWDDNIYAIDHTGAVKEGFPVTSTNRFNAPPTLVDLDGDGDLEIVAGNDSGLLHVLHHDGTEMASYDVGDDIRGGISVADLNDDGSYELLFAGYDDMIHVWNPMDGVELDGWPVDMEYNSLTEPVTADLDNDGDLEVVAAMKSGMVYVFHHDATLFNNFPTNLSGNIESSPAIGDFDNDGDYEIIFGTTQGLEVFDIKSEKGDRLSWKLHRGNLDRTGSLAMTLVTVDHEEDIIPKEFYVSPNYPNPFNPSTSLDIQTSERNDLNVRIFDATGRLVNTLINKELDAGHYTVKWNGLDAMGQGMPTGVYFIQVRSGVEISTQKMILIK